MPERAAIEEPGERATDVPHHEAHRTPDREIRPPARAEEVVAAVDVERAPNGTVDDHQDAGAAGGSARTVVAPSRIADALHRGDHDRHVLRLAAGHHRVDRDLLGVYR